MSKKLTKKQKEIAAKLHMSEEEYAEGLARGRKYNKRGLFYDKRQAKIDMLETELFYLKSAYADYSTDGSSKWEDAFACFDNDENSDNSETASNWDAIFNKLDEEGKEPFEIFDKDNEEISPKKGKIKEAIFKTESKLKKEKRIASVLDGICIVFCIEALIALQVFPIVKTLTKLGDTDVRIATEVASLKEQLAEYESRIAELENVDIDEKVDKSFEKMKNSIDMSVQEVAGTYNKIKVFENTIDNVTVALKELGYDVGPEIYKQTIEVRTKNGTIEYENMTGSSEYFDYNTGEKVDTINKHEAIKTLSFGEYTIRVSDPDSIKRFLESEDVNTSDDKSAGYYIASVYTHRVDGEHGKDMMSIGYDDNYNFVTAYWTDFEFEEVKINGELVSEDPDYTKVQKNVGYDSFGMNFWADSTGIVEYDNATMSYTYHSHGDGEGEQLIRVITIK